MTTTTDTPTAGELRHVPIGEIRVEEGANPRTRFDETALRELAGSIAQHGVIQPLVVSCADGGYTLIAGERRYRAAKLAGLDHVPVTIKTGEGGTFALAVDENLHRQALDPIEEAHAFEAILRTGKLTKKQLAERVSKKPQHVNERLRLLQLPEQIQTHVAAGALPVRLAKQLIEMGRVSPPVAVACAALVAQGHVEVDDLEKRPERVIGSLSTHEWPDPQPVALAVSSYHRYPIDSLPLPAESAAEIRRRAAALGEQVGFCFGPEDADAARGYGCLLEFKNGNYWSNSYITDPVFIADRVRLKLDHHERDHQERAQRAGTQPNETPAEPGQELELRRLERQERAEARQAAIGANFELGRKLQLRYDAPKITVQLARLLALLVLDGQADKLAGRGLRYTREDWQVIESAEVRGKTIDKTRYPHGHEAADQLYASITRARTPEQLIGRLLQALLAAHIADETAVAINSRIAWHTPGRHDTGPSSEIPTILDRFAKPVQPRQPAPIEEPDQPAAEAEAA